jgi:hypothetical protein
MLRVAFGVSNRPFWIAGSPMACRGSCGLIRGLPTRPTWQHLISGDGDGGEAGGSTGDPKSLGNNRKRRRSPVTLRIRFRRIPGPVAPRISGRRMSSRPSNTLRPSWCGARYRSQRAGFCDALAVSLAEVVCWFSSRIQGGSVIISRLSAGGWRAT